MITTQEIEQLIRDTITDIYKVTYVGSIIVEQLNPIGYCVKLGLNTPEAPLVICAALPDKQFIKYIKKELRERNLTSTIYYGLKTAYIDSCDLYTSRPCCNDKKRIDR